MSDYCTPFSGVAIITSSQRALSRKTIFGFIALLCSLFVTTGALSLSIADSTSANETILISRSLRKLGPPISTTQRRLNEKIFSIKFSLWHPTWTAATLADPDNIHAVEDVLFTLIEFFCFDIDFIFISSTDNQTEICSLFLPDEPQLRRRSLVRDDQFNQQVDEESWIGKTVISQGESIQVSEHSESNIHWITWVVHYYVLQLGDQFLNRVSLQQFEPPDQTIMEEGATRVMQSFIQYGLDANIQRGIIDERLESMKAFSSITGKEVETFKKKKKYLEIKSLPVPYDPSVVKTMRIFGALIFIVDVFMTILFGRLSKNRRLRLDQEAQAIEEARGGLVTNEGVDQMLGIGRPQSIKILRVSLGDTDKDTITTSSPESTEQFTMEPPTIRPDLA